MVVSGYCSFWVLFSFNSWFNDDDFCLSVAENSGQGVVNRRPLSDIVFICFHAPETKTEEKRGRERERESVCVCVLHALCVCVCVCAHAHMCNKMYKLFYSMIIFFACLKMTASQPQRVVSGDVLQGLAASLRTNCIQVQMSARWTTHQHFPLSARVQTEWQRRESYLHRMCTFNV